MAITTDKKSALQIFRPSVNILRDKDIRFNYTVTPNAQYVYTQLINDYKTGTRSFTITGAYGTGKSSFLLALQKTVNEEQPIFSGKPIDGPSSFAVLNVVGKILPLWKYWQSMLVLNQIKVFVQRIFL